jgi:hypothetical protein
MRTGNIQRLSEWRLGCTGSRGSQRTAALEEEEEEEKKH